MITNKKAYFDYEILETHECGIVLEGWEVKAIANKQCSISGTYCSIVNGEAFLIGSNIGTDPNEIQRTRKLLLHRHELNKLIGKVKEKGLTLIPLKVHCKKGKFKLDIGVAKGKKEYDKRESIKKREIELETRRIIKSQML